MFDWIRDHKTDFCVNQIIIIIVIMEVLRLASIMVLVIVLLQLLTIEDTIAFKDLMTDPDTFSNLETNEEVRR